SAPCRDGGGRGHGGVRADRCLSAFDADLPCPRDRARGRGRCTFPAMLLGVDVGGTFTDAVLVVGDRLHTAKAPTTPDDQSRGVMTAVERALDAAGAQAGDVEAFAHGM